VYRVGDVWVWGVNVQGGKGVRVVKGGRCGSVGCARWEVHRMLALVPDHS